MKQVHTRRKKIKWEDETTVKGKKKVQFRAEEKTQPSAGELRVEGVLLILVPCQQDSWTTIKWIIISRKNAKRKLSQLFQHLYFLLFSAVCQMSSITLITHTRSSTVGMKHTTFVVSAYLKTARVDSISYKLRLSPGLQMASSYKHLHMKVWSLCCPIQLTKGFRTNHSTRPAACSHGNVWLLSHSWTPKNLRAHLEGVEGQSRVTAASSERQSETRQTWTNNLEAPNLNPEIQIPAASRHRDAAPADLQWQRGERQVHKLTSDLLQRLNQNSLNAANWKPVQ